MGEWAALFLLVEQCAAVKVFVRIKEGFRVIIKYSVAPMKVGCKHSTEYFFEIKQEKPLRKLRAHCTYMIIHLQGLTHMGS